MTVTNSTKTIPGATGPTSTGDLTVTPVAGRIGARIDGVRLSADLPDDVVAAVRAALLEHKVVFFRGQDHLDDEAQTAFAGRLGTVTTAHPTVPALGGTATVLSLDSGNGGGRANHWHTDVTFVQQPPAASVLRALVIPPTGGDTLWANTATAYQDLPGDLRTLADRLWAVHTNAFDYARLGVGLEGADPQAARYAEIFASTEYETLHPVVRVHPETGERSLLLGGFARQISGLGTSDSTALLDAFQRFVTRPENTVRWHWAEGDVAIWDNRATQHYAIADYGTERRVVHRVTVAGDTPVSVDGTHSKALQGDASAYYRAA